MKIAVARLAVAALPLVCGTLRAETEADPVDRTVVRFVSRETGGVDAPRFVHARELAFEARLEALSEGAGPTDDPPYRTRHVRAALERHVAETVLQTLPITPPPTKDDVQGRIEQARLSLLQRVGGLALLVDAAHAEGIADTEVERFIRREALASLYLDRMVAPMLDPTDAELRSVHRTQRTPFSGKAYAEIATPLRRWYVGTRLATALASFYDGLRTRLTVTMLH